MPKLVDHATWRRRVTESAAALIAEEGLAGMTFRRLAARLDCSTTVISHYFNSRSELLASVYDATNAEAARIRQAARGDPARSPIETLEDLLPVSQATHRIWRIWLSFWNSALFDDALRDRHRRGIAGTRRELLNHFLAAGLPVDDATVAAEDVMEAIFGIAMQAVFDRDYWYPGRQLAAFRRAIARIAPPAHPGVATPARATVS